MMIVCRKVHEPFSIVLQAAEKCPLCLSPVKTPEIKLATAVLEWLSWTERKGRFSVSSKFNVRVQLNPNPRLI